MKVIRGYKYRIYPNKEQANELNAIFDIVKFTWIEIMKVLKSDIEEWIKDKRKRKPYPDIKYFHSILKELKKEFPMLLNAPAATLQQVTMQLTEKCKPHLVKRYNVTKLLNDPGLAWGRNRRSFRLGVNGFKIVNNRLKLPKSKNTIKIKWSRCLPSSPTMVYISCDQFNKYFVSFVCYRNAIPKEGTEVVGIDVGVSSLIISSNGITVENPRLYQKHSKRENRLRAALRLKKEDSRGSKDVLRRIKKLLEYKKRSREDLSNKIARRMVNDSKVIGIEGILIMKLLKNNPIAKYILDVAWGRIFYKLRYMAQESLNCTIVIMHPLYPSTQICNNCKTRSVTKIELGVTEWVCNTCGTVIDRDRNAAMNIRDKALEEFNASGGIWRSGGITAKLT